MKNNFIYASALAMLGLFATSCKDKTTTAPQSDKEQIAITHLSGETLVNVNPANAVVLDYGILDTYKDLDIAVKGVPQTNLPTYLSAYQNDTSLSDVGGIKEPNLEKINELDPELIIISARQVPLYDELSKIAPTINLNIDPQNYIASFKENQRIIGKLYNKSEQVEKELADIDDRLAKINAITQNSDKTALVVLANEGRLSAYGVGSRFGIIHDVFGLKPADKKIQVSTHGQSISNEFIKEINPDYIFVIDRGAAIKRASLALEDFANPLVQQTNAYKEGNIVFLDAEVWYLSGGGLESIKMMIEQIEYALNK